VETLPQKVDYREWVKADTEILYDLRSLQSQVRQKQVIWAIHHPPYGYLDQDENGIMGSKGVLGFLTESQPRLALFGHIHEAPRLTGAYITQLGKTLCVNPGGEHEEGLQAVVINTETLEIKKVKGGKRDDGNASSLRA
jgi:Icc-related predicted phosphoesterase